MGPRVTNLPERAECPSGVGDTPGVTPLLRRRVLPALVAATLLGLAGCGSSSGSTDAAAPTTVASGLFPGEQPVPVKEVGAVTLTDYAQDPAGEPFTMKADDDGLLLVYFGYLSCPDVCPLTMADTTTGLRELTPEEADRVDVAFVTVDLPRDDGARIASYLDHFFPDDGAHALRAADDGSLNRVTYEFGAKWEAEAHAPGDFYAVAHTGDTYVVDDQGRIVWTWPYGTTGDEIATALRSLLASTYPT